jgi:hypothetical protein
VPVASIAFSRLGRAPFNIQCKQYRVREQQHRNITERTDASQIYVDPDVRDFPVAGESCFRKEIEATNLAGALKEHDQSGRRRLSPPGHV